MMNVGTGGRTLTADRPEQCDLSLAVFLWSSSRGTCRFGFAWYLSHIYIPRYQSLIPHMSGRCDYSNDCVTGPCYRVRDVRVTAYGTVLP